MKRRLPVVPILIAINVGVYFLWVYYGGHDGDTNFMTDNFLVSWSRLADGRYWTLLGSAFSHNMFWHLLLNMFVLRSFGPIVEMVMGSKRFLIFYLFASIVSSFGHSFVSAWLLHEPDLPALGASGAISGVILFFSLMFPREKILLLGFIPLPALVGALAFVGLDIWGLTAQANGGGLPIGHGAHLGGALAGVVAFFYFRRQRQNELQAGIRPSSQRRFS